MDNRFYVYVFKSSKDAEIEIDNEIKYINKGDIYYVGKGTNDRVKDLNRNVECNEFTEILDGYSEIVVDDLTEVDALALEQELINTYENEYYLTNKNKNNKYVLKKEVIPIINFLNELIDKNIIQMSLNELSKETKTPVSSIRKIRSMTDYTNMKPFPPNNLIEILSKYKPKDDEVLIKKKEFKYLLNLIDVGIINMSLAKLCDYTGIYHKIAQEVRDSEIEPLRPSPHVLLELIESYGFHNESEKDILDGKIKACFNLREKFNLKLNDSEIAKLLNTNYSRVADVKRSKSTIKVQELSDEELFLVMKNNKQVMYD